MQSPFPFSELISKSWYPITNIRRSTGGEEYAEKISAHRPLVTIVCMHGVNTTVQVHVTLHRCTVKKADQLPSLMLTWMHRPRAAVKARPRRQGDDLLGTLLLQHTLLVPLQTAPHDGHFH